MGTLTRSCIAAALLLISGFATAQGLKTFTFAGQDLVLREQARVCYLGIMPVYDAYYYDTGRDNTTADPACVRLVYSRELKADVLEKGTRRLFALRHGEAATADSALHLDKVAEAYRDVTPGDEYAFCKGSQVPGTLMYNGLEVLPLHDATFAARYMRLWIIGAGTDEPRWTVDVCG